MAFLDRFKPKKESTLGKDKKPKHVVADKKSKAEDAKKRQFAAVPSAGDVKKSEAPKSDASVKAAPKRDKSGTGDAYRVLLRGVVSEKASLVAGQRKYIFMVSQSANKISVASAVKKLYGVTPVSVNIINVGGKALRYGRTEGRTKDWKKAMVTLKAGDSIQVTA